MPLPGTTGTDKKHKKEAMQVAVLEHDRPAAGVAVAGAATLNQGSGRVVSEALTTVAGALYTLTLTNSLIDANTLLFASASIGTGASASTQGNCTVCDITPGAGSCTILVRNSHATQAFNGTIQIDFMLSRKAPSPF